MSDALMYKYDGFVVLEVNQEEIFLSREELLVKLRDILLTKQDDLPLDLQRFSDVEKQAEFMLDTYCDFAVNPGEYLQWYAVRFEK